MTLKTHQKPYIKHFETWLERWGIETITPTVACAYVDAECAKDPLPLRRQRFAALAEVYGDVFRTRPWPYPLLNSYLDKTFEDVVVEVRGMAPDLRGWGWLVLVCGCAWPVDDFTVKDNVLIFSDRAVPTTDEVINDVLNRKKAPPRSPINVSIAHNALFERVCREGVDEPMRASLWGRWSAMKLLRAEAPVGLWKYRGGSGDDLY